MLRNAATEAVEWNELLKGRGKLSIMPQFTPQAHYNDKFQPLMEFLIAKGKPQVCSSTLSCHDAWYLLAHRLSSVNLAT